MNLTKKTRKVLKTIYVPGIIEAMKKNYYTDEAMLAVAEILFKAQGSVK